MLSKFGSKNDEYETESLDHKKRLKNDFLSQNPFKYDSSDSEEDDNIDEPNKKSLKKSSVKSDEVMDEFSRKLRERSSQNQSSALNENFFFSVDDDSRLKEATEFLSRTKEELDELR